MKSRPITIALAVSLLTAAVRCVGLFQRPFLYDEMMSITFAGAPLMKLLRVDLYLEPHPPLYYALLHGWMAFGESDWWIKLHLPLLGAVTAFALFWAGREILGERTAMLAAMAFAVSPAANLWGQQVRMYALMMLLGVVVAWSAHRLLSGRGRTGAALGFGFATLLFLYSHGAAFLIVPSIICYAGWTWLRGGTGRRRVIGMFAILGVVLLLYAPWLIVALGIEKGHPIVPGIRQVMAGFSDLWFGEALGWGRLKTAGAVVAAMMLGLVLVKRPVLRPLVISFALLPILFNLIVSYGMRPIWLARLMAFTVPFSSLVWGALPEAVAPGGAPESRGRIRSWGFAAILIGLLAGTFLQSLRPPRSADYEEIAHFFRTNLEAGDVVYVHHMREYEALSWYLIGSRSIEPVEPDFALESPEGIQLLSAPTNRKLRSRRSFWVVYEKNFNLNQVAPMALEEVYEMGHLYIAKARRLDLQ